MALAENLELQTRVPISELQPSVDTSSSCIRGIVALIWPYSSSKRSFSLLLAEPDFRLRRQKGQVRVTFTGSSAKLVARSGVTSGDGLVLGLVGVQWAKDEATLSTPGKGSEWELRFSERALLRVRYLDTSSYRHKLIYENRLSPKQNPQSLSISTTPFRRLSPKYNRQRRLVHLLPLNHPGYPITGPVVGQNPKCGLRPLF